MIALRLTQTGGNVIPGRIILLRHFTATMNAVRNASATNMNITLEDIQKQFAVIDTVPVNPAMESSQFVRMYFTPNALSLSLTGSMWARAMVAPIQPATEDKIAFYADRRVLKAFLSTAGVPANELKIAVSASKMDLTCGGQRLSLPNHAQISGYETWKPGATFTLPDESLKALPILARYCSTIPGLERVGAIRFVKDYGVIASDTVFLAVETAAPKSSFFINPTFASAVASQQGAALSADAGGAGMVFPSGGFVYQPYPAGLDDFPEADLQKYVKNVQAAPVVFTCASDFLCRTVKTAMEFLLGVSDAATVSSTKKTSVLLTVNDVGKFERALPAKVAQEFQPVTWPIKNILPWIAYVAESCPNIEYIRLQDASAFHAVGDSGEHFLIFSDR